jgi:hypothetical protein
VMNLVALLIAPLVVEHAQNEGLRAGVAILIVAILAAAIWNSKRRKADELVEEPPSGDSAQMVSSPTPT